MKLFLFSVFFFGLSSVSFAATKSCTIHIENLVGAVQSDEVAIFNVEKALSKRGYTLERDENFLRDGDIILTDLIGKNLKYNSKKLYSEPYFFKGAESLNRSPLIFQNSQYYVGGNLKGCNVQGTAVLKSKIGNSTQVIGTLPYDVHYNSELGCHHGRSSFETLTLKVVGKLKKCRN